MDELLIKKVQRHEMIYNYKSPNYRDHSARRAVWEKIGEELNISGNLAKQRWDSLRRCFSNALNRRRDGEKRPSWKFEKEMSFLLPFIEERKSNKDSKDSRNFISLPVESDGFLVEGYETEETTNFKTEYFKNEFETSLDIHSNDSNGKLADENVATSPIDSDEVNTTDSRNIGRRKERTAKNFNSSRNSSAKKRKFIETDHEYKSNLSGLHNLLDSLDNTDMFFLSMSKMTKELPKGDQARIKLEISNLILQAEIRNTESSAPSTSKT